jgi:hypothetical protein
MGVAGNIPYIALYRELLVIPNLPEINSQSLF